MGLLRFQKFSSIPNLFRKIQQRTRRTEDSDIAKRPLDKTEFIFENGLLVISGGQATNTTTTFFTVPDDNVYYMISASLGWRTSAAGVADIVRLTIGNAGQFIMNSSNLTNELATNMFNFSLPLKLIAGQTVSVRSTDLGVLARANIVGYQLTLEQEKLFKF